MLCYFLRKAWRTTVAFWSIYYAVEAEDVQILEYTGQTTVQCPCFKRNERHIPRTLKLTSEENNQLYY